MSERKLKYSDGELLQFIVDLKGKLGRVPSTTDIDREVGYPKASIYSKRFGSYENALKKLGLKRESVRRNLISDEEMLSAYRKMFDYYGRKPTFKEMSILAKNYSLPSRNSMVNRFGSIDEIHKLLGLEYKTNKYEGYQNEFLLSELKRFNKEHGRPPTSKDLDGANTGYPSRKTFSKYFGSFGNALLEAGFEYRGIENPRGKIYPNGIKSWDKENSKEHLFKYIEEFQKVPTIKELELVDGYPTRHDFRKLYGSYSNALAEYGITPNSKTYTDKELKDAFFNFVETNGRIPVYTEFNNSRYPSFWCYQNRFGSWNNAVRHYGFEPFSHKDIENLKNDIVKLCNSIFHAEGRKIITTSDIEKSESCSSVGSYSKNFKKHLNLTLREFVKSIGFEMPQSGLGMVYEFEDGEVTTSKYEYMVSTYFRSNNISYSRNVKYKHFIENYSGNKDCDYVIECGEKKLYLEVAGMIDHLGSNKNNFINKNYEKNIKEKESMFQKEKLNYRIIYPSDFKNKSLDEMFSFLQANKKLTHNAQVC